MVKRVGNVFEKKTKHKVGRHKKNLNKGSTYKKYNKQGRAWNIFIYLLIITHLNLVFGHGKSYGETRRQV